MCRCSSVLNPIRDLERANDRSLLYPTAYSEWHGYYKAIANREKNSSLRRNNTKSVTKGWRELGKVKKASSNVVAWSNNFIIWNICQCTILRYIILARRRAQKSDFERFASLSPFDCTTRLPLPSPKSSRVFVCLCFFPILYKNILFAKSLALVSQHSGHNTC